MIKAIQVLRIHLLELEKVSELCKDFCQRYITCLRTKMNSENLLRGTSCVGSNSGNQTNSNSFFDGSSCSSNGSSDDYSLTSPSSTFPSNSTTQTVYQMVQTSQGLVAQPIQLTAPQQQQIHGSTPISQIGSNNNNNNSNSTNNKIHHINNRADSSNEEDLSDDMGSNHSGSKKKQQKRGVLPKQATTIMRSWLFQHIVHPYPTEDEKRSIASQTNLTLLQVNNWFINARRRILQPMLDTANSLNESQGQNQNKSTSKNTSTKKLKTTSMQRFWPESIANAIQSATQKDEPK
jgi:hypothetical protein